MKISTQSFSSFRPFEIVISIENQRDLEAIASLANADHTNMSVFLNKFKYEESYEDFSEKEDSVIKIMDICIATSSR